MTLASNILCFFLVFFYNSQMKNYPTFLGLHHGSLLIQNLLVLPPPTELKNNQPKPVGRDCHLALYVTDIHAIQLNLKENNVCFTMSHSGRQALFCRDPDGNGLEFIEKIIMD
jgi:hypothetical protein